MNSGESHVAEPSDAESLSSLTAEGIVRALRSADRREVSVLVAELIRRFEPLTRRMWGRLGGNPSEYSDFRQEVWLKVLRSLPQLQDPAAFAGFFRRLVLNSAYDELRRSSSRERLLVPLEGNEEAPELTDALEDVDNAILVRSYLEALPQRERDVLEKEFLDGLSVSEIARDWGISEGAVRMTKSRAINKLRAIVHKGLSATTEKVGGG
jgi:RNA polymerase sigma-70 factor, ECF subfamily